MGIGRDDNDGEFYYPDGDWCFRAIQTVHAIFQNSEGKLIAQTEKGDRNGYYELEITELEMIGLGERHK